MHIHVQIHIRTDTIRIYTLFMYTLYIYMLYVGKDVTQTNANQELYTVLRFIGQMN